MSTFEIGTGIVSATANRFLATIHSKFHQEFFAGAATEKIEIPLVGDVEVGVTWNVTEAPLVDFSHPKAPKDLVEKELAKHKLSEEMEKNRPEVIKSLADAVIASSFEFKLPKIVIDIKDPTETLPPKEEFAVISVICLQMEQGKLSINPIQIASSGASEILDNLLNTVVLPAIQEMVRSLPAIDVPQVDLDGLVLAPMIPYISNDKAMAQTSRLDQPAVAPPPVGFQWPGSPFSFLLKQDFLTNVATQIIQGQSHQLIDINHGFNIGVASAKFQITAALSNFTITPGATATDFNLSVNLVGKGVGNAWTIPMFWPIGVNFDISTENPIEASVSIIIENGKLIIKCNQVKEFEITLKPSGGVAEWIISIFASPVLEFIISILRPRIEEWLKGQRIELFEIPSITHIPVANKTISITTENVKLVNLAGYATIEGDVKFD